MAGRKQEPFAGLLYGGRFDLPAPWRTHQRRGRYRRQPIITEGKNGKLLSTDKVRGRKQALRTLAELAAQNIDDPAEAEMYVLHADAPEDADRLAQLLREKIPGLGNISIRYVGPVIGAHCGPGTVAVCFFGKERPY